MQVKLVKGKENDINIYSAFELNDEGLNDPEFKEFIEVNEVELKNSIIDS